MATSQRANNPEEPLHSLHNRLIQKDTSVTDFIDQQKHD